MSLTPGVDDDAGAGGVTIPDVGEPPTVDPPKPEAKDVRRPRLSRLRASARRSGLVLRLRVDEPVTVTARVLRGRKLLAKRSGA